MSFAKKASSEGEIAKAQSSTLLIRKKITKESIYPMNGKSSKTITKKVERKNDEESGKAKCDR